MCTVSLWVSRLAQLRLLALLRLQIQDVATPHLEFAKQIQDVATPHLEFAKQTQGVATQHRSPCGCKSTICSPSICVQKLRFCKQPLTKPTVLYAPLR